MAVWDDVPQDSRDLFDRQLHEIAQNERHSQFIVESLEPFAEQPGELLLLACRQGQVDRDFDDINFEAGGDLHGRLRRAANGP
jgi:hypothetical protein